MMHDIEKWTKNKRNGGCSVCELPSDVLDNLDYGWNKLGLRERSLFSYLTDRGWVAEGVTRHFIRRHYKENHVRGT